MTAARTLFFAHLGALIFALGGLLIALPHPELWAGSAQAAKVFAFGMRHGGALHIVLGAAAMLAFGLRYLGAWRTLTFFALATTLSLGMELLGTGTGWPFGAYSYTSGLGMKVLGRVPYTIPLSWFFVGLAAYLLASAIVARLGLRRSALSAVLLGVWFLTVWDLVLDPAMAHPSLPMQFWVWHATGPYFGMPLQNFVGWSVTGLLFMGLSRLLWRRNASPDEFPAWLPFGIYTANIIFALALSLSVGLWEPAVAAVLLGVLPATLALGRTTSPAATAIRLGSRVIAGRRLQLTVEGLEHIPASGPALIAARHYHHLYDGCALITTLPRPVHILVALDWVDRPIVRRVMERACAAARWPIVLRGDALTRPGARTAYSPAERRRYLHRAVTETVDLLRAGEVVVVFPEAYPNVDPTYTPKTADGFLPFRPGFAALAALAERDGHPPVPIIPAGLAYRPGDRWELTLRFGPPLFIDDWPDRAALVAAVEQQVRDLSRPAPAYRPAVAGEVLQP